MVLCRVMFLLRWENFTSTSFLGFRERCQYLHKRSKQKVKQRCGRLLPNVRVVWHTCTWTQVWAEPLLLCKPPERSPLGSPSVWSLGWAPERRAWNAASCAHTRSWFPPSSSLWSSTKERRRAVSRRAAPHGGRRAAGLTCRRCVCRREWRWWSRPASYSKTLSLHSATAVASPADAEPWEERTGEAAGQTGWHLCQRLTAKGQRERGTVNQELTIWESLVNSRIWTCCHRPQRSSHLITCTTPSAERDNII